jgi:L1 cell adhesion molecule like protein
VPQIEVTFEIDANGILNVGANEKSSGKSETITITNEKGRLSKEEIEKMMQEAEDFKKEDEERLECIQAKNQLENSIYQYKGMVDDDKVKSALPQERRDMIHSQLSGFETWLDANQTATKEEYEAKSSELQDVAKAIQEEIQSAMQNQAPAQDQSSSQTKEPTIEEVD